MKKTYQYDYRTQHIVEVKCIRMNSKVQFRQELTGELQKSDACLIVCEGNCHSCFKLDVSRIQPNHRFLT